MAPPLAKKEREQEEGELSRVRGVSRSAVEKAEERSGDQCSFSRLAGFANTLSRRTIDRATSLRFTIISVHHGSRKSAFVVSYTLLFLSPFLPRFLCALPSPTTVIFCPPLVVRHLLFAACAFPATAALFGVPAVPSSTLAGRRSGGETPGGAQVQVHAYRRRQRRRTRRGDEYVERENLRNRGARERSEEESGGAHTRARSAAKSGE